MVERVGRLTVDELDRLALAEPAPIAFLATLRQFVQPDLERTLDDAEREAIAALPARRAAMAPIRDAVVGRLADVIIGDVLEEILGDPAALVGARTPDAWLGFGGRAAALRSRRRPPSRTMLERLARPRRR